jgi:phospholipid/cholesterol/gamma-HCH transport system substrate-binding protein
VIERTFGSRGLRNVAIIALVAVLIGGVYVLFSSGGNGRKIVGYFTSAVGLYPGDQVRILGVPVGEIDTIEPRPSDVKITMSVSNDVKIPKDAQAVIMSPNLVSARFIQITPAYTGGAVLPDGGSIDLARTAVPVEWDEVKEALTQLAVQLGPTTGSMHGPLGAAINQAADTLDGKGESFHNALQELSQVAGRLGDSRSDIFGTVKNLQVLVDALSASNEQIVQFAGNVASVSQVLADSSRHLDNTLGTLNTALSDIRGFLHENNSTLIDTVNQLNDFAQTLSDQSDNIEQVLHVAGPGIANFYNIYDPAQGTLNGLLSIPEFANPVQFICGGSFETAGGPKAPDYFRRAELCRERLGPVLRRLSVNYPPVMFHPLNTITAYKGQIIYDTPETQAKSATPIPQLTWIPAKGVTPPAAQNPADLQSLLVTGCVPESPGLWSLARPPTGPAAYSAAGRAGGRRMRRIWLRGGALAAGSALLAGCQFGGLNSVAMPGTAGHGSGAYSITVEMPDVATLPQNSPVMVDDVTVGSVSGISAEQRTDGSFYAAVKLALDKNVVLPSNATATVAQTSLLGSLHIDLARPKDKPAVGRLTDGSKIGESHTGRYPTTEEVLSALGVVVNKGNVGALAEITDETYQAVAGRQHQFVDLVPRLAELTAGLNRQVNDIIDAVDGLNRFSATVAQDKDNLGRALDTLPEAIRVLNKNRDHIVEAFAALKKLATVTSHVLSKTKVDFAEDLKGLYSALKALNDNRKNFVTSLQILPTFPFPNFGIKQAVRGDYLNVFTTFDLTLRRLGETFFTTSYPLDPNMMHMSEILNTPDFLTGEMANLSGQAADPFKIPPGTASQ